MNNYKFDDWLIEPESNRIQRGTETKQLEPQAMNVLSYLLEGGGDVVTVNELLDRFWTGRVAGPNVVARCINQIRRFLGDDAINPHYIETIRKRGYRAIAPITMLPGSEVRTDSTIASSIGIPRIELLAHAAPSSSEKAIKLSLDLRYEILRIVRVWPGIELIEDLDMSGPTDGEIGRANNVAADYLLSLDVSSHHTQSRISLEICCEETALHQVTNVVAPDTMLVDDFNDFSSAIYRWFWESIQQDMRKRFAGRQHSSLEFWELVNGSNQSSAGIQMLKHAVSRFPGEAIGHALLANIGAVGTVVLGLPKKAIDRESVKISAHKALQLSPNDPIVLSCTSYAFALLGELEKSLSLAKEAADQLPYFRLTTIFPLIRLGRGEEAVEVLDRFVSWGLPVQPEWWTAYAEALAVQRKYDELVVIVHRGLDRTRAQQVPLLAHYANALGHRGELASARLQWELVGDLAPNLTIDTWERLYKRQLATDALLDAVAGGLRKAYKDGNV